MTDGRVLHTIAEELDRPIDLPDVQATRYEIARVGAAPQATRHDAAGHDAAGHDIAGYDAAPVPQPAAGQALLASWHWLLDDGSLQDGEPFLAGTAKRARLHLSAATAAEIGAVPGELVTVASERGSLTLPLVLADLPDRVVWVPMRSPDAAVRRDLAVGPGALVTLTAAGSTP